MADLSITPASVVFVSGEKETAVAGAAFGAGQTVYQDPATGLLQKALAAGTAAQADAIGIALHTSAANQPLTYAKNGARLIIGATTVKTTTYVVSANVGGIAPQADLVSTNKIVRMGYAVDTTGTFVVDIANTGAVV